MKITSQLFIKCSFSWLFPLPFLITDINVGKEMLGINEISIYLYVFYCNCNIIVTITFILMPILQWVNGFWQSEHREIEWSSKWDAGLE